jgi:pyruvate/2-oxoglutarate/acetoin dehydrogenase E1 component
MLQRAPCCFERRLTECAAQELFDELDAPVKRLCMDDAPVPYASSMEQAVVKRAADLVQGVADIVQKKF